MEQDNLEDEKNNDFIYIHMQGVYNLSMQETGKYFDQWKTQTYYVHPSETLIKEYFEKKKGWISIEDAGCRMNADALFTNSRENIGRKGRQLHLRMNNDYLLLNFVELG